MDTPEKFRRAMQDVCDQGWALAALTAAVESGLAAGMVEPRGAAELASRAGTSEDVATALVDVLVALGMASRDGDRYQACAGMAPFLAGHRKNILVSDLRSALLQSGFLVAQAKRGDITTGWQYTDPEIIQAQGLLSEGALEPMAQALFPQLDGLLERLDQPGAAVLDVGAGAAGLSIAFARRFPQARVVGLEPAPVPLSVGQRNVAASDVGHRIELRAIRVEELGDEGAFDFAWLPQMFLPTPVLERALAAVRRALKPGGWLLTAAVSIPGDTVQAAAARLRNTLWGGGRREAAELRALVEAAGFAEVRTGQSPGPFPPIVARR